MSRNKEKKNNIMLIGFMGSGKSSIGIKLSYKLQLALSDTDKMIEANEGMSIKELFSLKGENYFRQAETKLLYDIIACENRKIYSLGGGTPIALQNQALICRAGKVVYLRAKPETIYDRLKGDTTRPLLQCEDPLGRIKDLMSKRSAIYERCADLIIDVDEFDQSQIVDMISNFILNEG